MLTVLLGQKPCEATTRFQQALDEPERPARSLASSISRLSS